MDMITLGLFLAAAFADDLVSGVSGFAMGLVVSGVWLYIITLGQSALLIVLCGVHAGNHETLCARASSIDRRYLC
jgi:hypothetical protein